MTAIDGKVVVLTGASSGIGEATALRLGAAGARLVLGARRQDRLEALAARIDRSDVAWAATDVTRRGDVDALVALATERFGRLDAIVNNAGIGPISPFDQLKVDEWEAMIDVNLRGVLYGIAAALPVFRAQGGGHVVNVSSTADRRIVPGQGVYAATKTAVRVLTEGLRQEAGPDVRVTLVSPGYTHTAFAEAISDQALRTQILAGRDTFAMAPDAVARAIAFAIEQPPEVEMGEIVVRPTAQS